MNISKNVRSLGLVSLFNDISSEMIQPLLPIFLSAFLGVSVTFIGIIEGIADAVMSLLKLASGWLSDKVRKRKGLVILGYAVAVCFRSFLGFVQSGLQVLIIRFFDRTGKGIRGAPRDALISESSEPENFGKSFGFHRAMDHFGAVLGPLIAFFLLYFIGENESSIRTIFFIAVIPGIIALLIIIFGVREKRQESKGLKKEVFFRLSEISSMPLNFKKFLFIIGIFTLGNSSDAFLILKAKEAGIKLHYIPILWILLNFIKSITSIPAGSISDRIGRRKVILSGWLIYAISYFGFAFLNSSYEIFLLFAFYGIYHGFCEGTERAYIADMVSADKRGLAYGMFHFITGISIFPASLIMGLLWDKFGSVIAFCFCAFMAIISSFLLFVILRKKI